MNGLGLYCPSGMNSVDLFDAMLRDTLSVEQYISTKYTPLDFEERDIEVQDLQFFNPTLHKPRHILNLKSNLGKQINRFIFEESGVLIGNALKSARNKEALFGGVLGIRHFCKDDAQYYYSGYLGKSINRSFPHACRIRKVCSTGQTLQFQRYLPLLEVDFIRANGWTVNATLILDHSDTEKVYH